MGETSLLPLPRPSCSLHNYDIRRTIEYTSENISYLLSGAKILTFDTMNFHERMAYPWRDSRPALKSLWCEDPFVTPPTVNLINPQRLI